MKSKILAKVHEKDHATAQKVIEQIAHDHKLKHHHVTEVVNHPLAPWLFSYFDRCRNNYNNVDSDNDSDNDIQNNTVSELPSASVDAIQSSPMNVMPASMPATTANTKQNKLIKVLQNYGK